jgi:glucan 1,3-beta-glucosidase
MHGVNLGGWLVLEEFIAPSLWRIHNDTSVIDQWTWCEHAKNHSDKIEALRQHWDTWLTEEDMQSLHDAGVTHVRIPIGYWSLMSQRELDYYYEPFINGEWQYLVRGLRWAKKYNISAIIDLHAAPGSQNPWQHSGRAFQSNWGRGNTVNRTLEIIQRIASRVKEFENDTTINGTVVGIAVLNEPFPGSLVDGGFAVIKYYYQRAYQVIRRYLPASNYMVIIDAAFTWDAWYGFMPAPQYENVVVDLHRYQCFDPYLRSAPLPVHWNITCHNDKVLPPMTLPTIVGEWSVGYKVEADWAWNEPFPTSDEQVFLKKWALAQMNTYEHNSLGWFFWNFKTESAPMWDFLLGVRQGWLPCQLPVQQDVDAACTDYSTPTCLNRCSGSTLPVICG